MKESCNRQAWEQWLSFNFAANKLKFHPQTAEDCGWKASVEGFYEVRMYMNTYSHLAG